MEGFAYRVASDHLYIETLHIDDLVDQIYSHFSNNFVIGEVLRCHLSNYEYVYSYTLKASHDT